jgi:hypothetical protein
MKTPFASFLSIMLFPFSVISQMLQTLPTHGISQALELAPLPQMLSTSFLAANRTINVVTTARVTETLEYV